MLGIWNCFFFFGFVHLFFVCVRCGAVSGVVMLCADKSLCELLLCGIEIIAACTWMCVCVPR